MIVSRTESWGEIRYDTQGHTLQFQRNESASGILKISNPVFLNIDLTTRCNMHCDHCLAKDMEKALKTSKSTDLVIDRDLLNKINSSPFMVAVITGGEPLLKDRETSLIKLVSGIHRKGIIVDTNGTVHPSETLQELLRTKDVLVRVSWDHPDAEKEYELKKPGGRRGKTLDQHLESKLNIIRALVSKGVIVGIQSVMHGRNWNDDDFYSLPARMKELGVTSWYVQRFIPSHNKKKDKKYLLAIEDYQTGVERAHREASRCSIRCITKLDEKHNSVFILTAGKKLFTQSDEIPGEKVYLGRIGKTTSYFESVSVSDHLARYGLPKKVSTTVFLQPKDRTIIQWTEGFKTLYASANKMRRPEEFWNSTMALISEVGEAVRRDHYKDLVDAAAHTFCWMCSYVAKCNETEDSIFKLRNSLSEIVALKYPSQCGHCQALPCRCHPVEMDTIKDKSAMYESLLETWANLNPANFTLRDFLNMFWKIYGSQIHLLVMQSIAFHLLEEAGEEAKAVRRLIEFRGVVRANIPGIDDNLLSRISDIKGLVNEYVSSIKSLKEVYQANSEKEMLTKIDLSSKDPKVIKARLVKSKIDFVIEIADTFSWFCAVLLKLQQIIRSQGLKDEESRRFDIEEVLKQRYQSTEPSTRLTCYACKTNPCKCVFFLETRTL